MSAERVTRLYVAGPMTGLPEFNYPAFNDAEIRLTARGYTVLNPARHGFLDGYTWADYMRLGIADVVASEGVCILPGWEKSRGAGLEVHVAASLGLPVRPEAEWLEWAVR